MEKFAWEISKKDRGTPWGAMTIMTVVFGALAIYLFFVENYFGAALLIISPVVMLVLSTQGPKKFDCEINNEGIKVNNKFYPFKKLSFFAIIADSLIVKVKKEDVVYVPVYLEDVDVIRDVMSERLKEKEEFEENFAQLVNRLLRIH